jgi:GntR family transcriptional regulator, transcriptional repressor for pyruvate dehydrogenase complex
VNRPTGADLQTLAFRPVQSPRTFEVIVSQIKDAIMDGRLTVGSRLPSEREMMKVFSVSRSSLREALRVLEALGVLSARRGTGPEAGYVIAPAQDNQFASLWQLQAILLHISLLDLLEVRETVETMTIALACQHATVDDREQLRLLIGKMEAASEPEAFLECDTGFHVAIARSSGNAAVPLVMEALRGAIAHKMLDAFRQLDDWPSERANLVREHQHILEAIESGDVSKAADVIHAHLHGFYSRLPASVQDAKPGNETGPRTAG